MRVPRRAVAGVATLAVLGVGYAGYAAAADDPSYRTARATVGDLQETLDLSGTVEPAGRADLSFATSGTVATLKVEPGDTVRAGQTLGTLDSASLRKALQQARAALASAKAQLESDEEAQTSSVSEATGGTPTGQSPQGTPSGGTPQSPQSPTAPTSPTGPSDSPGHGSDDDGDDGGQDNSALLAQLKTQQEAVTTAQSTVSASLAAADQALAAQQAACADVTSQACSDALVAVQAAQQQVSTDQQALQDALDALAATLSTALGTATGSTSADPAAARTESSSGDSGIVLVAATSGTGDFGGSGGASGGTVTAATLAQDQAAIDQAKADLVAAQQQLAMATVTAPFAGRIVAVDASVGESVAAGSEAFVLVSQGTTTVQVAATSTQVQELKLGQAATATPAGADRALAGTVTQVSSVPDDDSTYAVTITLKRKHLDIATGLTASVAVVTGTAEDVVTVPASAVSDGSVLVVEDGTATRTRVTTGVVGSTRVEITDGLEKGDEVVLADLSAAVPTGDSESQTLRFGGGGGPGGGSFQIPSGGFPGGGQFRGR